MTRFISATEFKANCLRLIDEMNEQGEPITVMRHGKPVAVLSPVAKPFDPTRLFGCLENEHYSFDDAISPVSTDEDWNAFK